MRGHTYETLFEYTFNGRPYKQGYTHRALTADGAEAKARIKFDRTMAPTVVVTRVTTRKIEEGK